MARTKWSTRHMRRVRVGVPEGLREVRGQGSLGPF